MNSIASDGLSAPGAHAGVASDDRDEGTREQEQQRRRERDAVLARTQKQQALGQSGDGAGDDEQPSALAGVDETLFLSSPSFRPITKLDARIKSAAQAAAQKAKQRAALMTNVNAGGDTVSDGSSSGQRQQQTSHTGGAVGCSGGVGLAQTLAVLAASGLIPPTAAASVGVCLPLNAALLPSQSAQALTSHPVVALPMRAKRPDLAAVSPAAASALSAPAPISPTPPRPRPSTSGGGMSTGVTTTATHRPQAQASSSISGAARTPHSALSQARIAPLASSPLPSSSARHSGRWPAFNATAGTRVAAPSWSQA